MSQRIALEIDHRIARVRLDRPQKRNALDLPMFEAIVDVQRRLRREKTVRVVLLHGAGVDFCSGLDVGALMRDRAGMRRLLWKWLPWRANLAQQVSVGWRRLPLPVIAALQGRCWGGGLQIALGADFRLASATASLSVMEGKWGLVPDMGGTLALRELLRRDQALRLAMTATEISGTEALALGLVTALDDDPLAAGQALAEQLLQRSPDAIAAVKRLYRKSWNSGSGRALARETGYQLRILTGANQGIAVARQTGKSRDYRPAGKW